jgi:hypothetical protein
MSDADKPSSSGRWWEYYFIRYFFGTVIGAALVVLLADSLDPFKKLISPLLHDSGKAGVMDLTGIVGIGLAYCYIASAPMLVLHALRAQLFAISPGNRAPKNASASPVSELPWWHWIGLVALLLPTCIVLGYIAAREWSKTHLGVLCLVIAILFQAMLILAAHKNKFVLIREFYKNLSEARTASESRDYVDSYRHMREHSNAYAIIILELILAPAVVAADSPWQLAFVTLAWLAPAGYCWLIASLLEAEFADRNSSQTT